MADDREPDWSYEAAKAKAAISRNAVMSDEEKSAAHQNIEKKWAEHEARWKRRQVQERLAQVISAGEERFREEYSNEETQHPPLGDQEGTHSEAMSEALGQINNEKHETIRIAEEEYREQYLADDLQAASTPPLQDQENIDFEGLADSFSRNHREKFKTIREAEQRQKEEYERERKSEDEAQKENNLLSFAASSHMVDVVKAIKSADEEAREQYEAEQMQANATKKDGHLREAEARLNGSTETPAQVRRVVVTNDVVQRELPIVATPLKSAIEAALFQIDEYHNEIRQNNLICAEHPEIFEMLDRLKDLLTNVQTAIPESTESVSEEEAEEVASYMQRLKTQGAIEFENYLSPESVMKGAAPTAIVLAFGVVGSFFGDWGHIAGGALGGIFTKNAKPNATLDEVNDALNSDGDESS